MIYFSLLLANFFGVYGIILGTVLSGIISLAMILIRFKKIFGLGNQFSSVLIEIAKNILAMIGTVVIILWLKTVFDINSLILSIVIYGMGTILVYLILILLLRTRMRHIKL